MFIDGHRGNGTSTYYLLTSCLGEVRPLPLPHPKSQPLLGSPVFICLAHSSRLAHSGESQSNQLAESQAQPSTEEGPPW